MIERARLGSRTPHPRNQVRLLQALVAYFSYHPLPTFETIERLDSAAITAEVRERATAIGATSHPGAVAEALVSAREELAAAYNERIRAAIALLGL